MSDDLLLFDTVTAPPAPRTYAGNMCGVRIPDLPPIPGGGSADPTLALSWFYPFYDAVHRTSIRRSWQGRYPDVLLSWPDAHARGFSVPMFINVCAELVADAFRPCVFFASKDFDAPDVASIVGSAVPCLRGLIAAQMISRACVGFELNLFLSPAQVQQLIDMFSSLTVPAGIPLYVHFSSGYFAYQPDGGTTADFWNLNRHKLRGILHQRDPNEDHGDQGEYQARIKDCLDRFAGGFGFVPPDPPNDFIACEITASEQFNETMDEATGDAWGRAALATPPSGSVRVMGSGNGQ